MIKFKIEGEFSEAKSKSLALIKGWKEFVDVEIPPTEEGEPSTFGTEPNPQTYIQFIEQYYLDFCAKDIAKEMQLQEYRIKEAAFIEEINNINSYIESDVKASMTVNSEII